MNNNWFTDSTVETDGSCKISGTRRSKSLCWITQVSLSEALLQQQQHVLLLDMRSFTSFNVRHIKTAQSLCFSPILMRRMLKGFISLDSLVTDPALFTAIETASMVVLYDSNSKPGTIKEELLKFSEMLLTRFSSLNLRILIGGMNNFEDKFQNLCTSGSKSQSPTSIAIDTTKLGKKEREGIPEGKPVEILPFLYLGSAKDSADIDYLRKMGITAVLNITTTCPNFFESEFQYLSILVEDSPQTDLHARLQQAIKFIDDIKRKGGKVFVHCHAGISRSATVCIAYVMQYRRLSAQEAYVFVKSRRPIISPNLSFMGQLILFQQDLISTRATTETRGQCTSSLTHVVTTSTETSTTKSTSPKQSLATSNLKLSSHSLLLTERHVHETFMVSQLTDLLRVQPQSGICRNPPMLTNSDRSFSVPDNRCTLKNVFKRKRDELSLSLDLHNPVSQKSSQTSPCRVEACTFDGKMTQSLTLSTTCT